MKPMFSEESRLATFKPSTATRRRQTKADINAQQTPLWPHPSSGRASKSSGIPTPAMLARYGFYYEPSEQQLDRTIHFLYQTVTSDWKAGDDPLQRLDQLVPGNGWCKIWWSKQSGTLSEDQTNAKQWVWSDQYLLPNSQQMSEARKETFGQSWPYDGKKGWKPTSKKLAEAGFYFTPTNEEPDSATCIYCNKGLGGWEKNDDPTYEHQKREPDCAFFNCIFVGQPEKSVAAENQDQATEAEEEEEEETQDAKLGRKTKRTVSTTATATTTTTRKASARVAKGKKGKQMENQEDDQEQQEEAVQEVQQQEETVPNSEAEPMQEFESKPLKKAKRGQRSVSSKVTEESAVTEQAANEEETADQDEQTTLKRGKRVASATRTARSASRQVSRSVAQLVEPEPDQEETSKTTKAQMDSVNKEPSYATTTATTQEDEKVPPKTRGRSKKTAKQSIQGSEPELEPRSVERQETEENDATIIEHDMVPEEEEEEESPQQPKEACTNERVTKTTKGKNGKNAKSKAKSGSTKKASSASAKPTDVLPTTQTDEVELEVEVHIPLVEETDSELAPPPPPTQSKTKRGSSKATASKKAVTPTMTESEIEEDKEVEMVLESETRSCLEEDEREPETDAEEDAVGYETKISVQEMVSCSSSPLRAPLAHLPLVNQLDLNDSDRNLTLGQWLQVQTEAAADEMRKQGQLKILELENRMRQGRQTIERRLRGQV